MSKRKLNKEEDSQQVAHVTSNDEDESADEQKRQKTEVVLGEGIAYPQSGSTEASDDHDLQPYKTNLESYDPVLDELIKDMGQKSKMLHLTWAGIFSENEKYEVFLPTRLQKLIDEARAIEANLLQQKEQAMQRLVLVSKALKIQ